MLTEFEVLAKQMRDATEEQKKQIDIIHSASGHLLNLINDILDLSKIESEKINFERIVFNPREQIEEAVKFLNPKVTDKGLTTTLTFDDNVPDSIIGDPLRLKQVILNLLGNSIKFTNTGGIKISVTGVKDSPAPGKVNLCVVLEDTGIGIAPEDLPRLGQPFEQAGKDDGRNPGGS